MGMFSSIRNAIFGHHDEASAKAVPHPAAAGARPASGQPQAAPAQSAAAPKPQPLQEVDLERQLDAKPGADKLNWRTSIVDLMKLVGIDASYENRKELAQELGRQDYSGSAEDNIWLHKRTMEELAKNGAKVPSSMLA